jgi:alanine racemase
MVFIICDCVEGFKLRLIHWMIALICTSKVTQDTFNMNQSDNKDNRSMANSAAILSLPESLFDVVRPGIMLYGASPFNDNHSNV